MKKLYIATLAAAIVFSVSNLYFAQETVIIQDSLKGNTVGSKVGGTLTSEGYKPGVGNNHILYVVPSQVTNGYMEFQLKGFAHSVVPTDADNGFACLYDGRGISEPISYFSNFRENFFRWNFHWRQNRNAVKCVLTCAAPTPLRLNETKAVFTAQNSPTDSLGNPIRDWFQEPTGSTISWNSNQWYTVKIEWKNKAFKVVVNGISVWSTTGPYDYAPINFKIWIGSAPGKYANTVPDLMFRNFKLVSYNSMNIAPIITSIAPNKTLINKQYLYDVAASGNPTPIFSLTVYPLGMTIDPATGLIQWTPTATGNYPITVKASNGVNPDATQSYILHVRQHLPRPSNLLANILNNNILLNWSDNSTNELGFIVFRKNGDSLSTGVYNILDSINANVNFYEDSNVNFAQTYTYKVFAYDADTISEASNLVQINTTLPVVLINFKANVFSDQVKLEWETATEKNNSGFFIQRSRLDEKFVDIAFIKGNGTTTQISKYYFVDKSISVGKYYYRLKQIDLDGTCTYSKIVSVNAIKVSEFILEQNYPNPFNPITTIKFGIMEKENVKLTVHNIIGEEIEVLLDEEKEAGYYTIEFKAKELTSGIYFYRINSGNYVDTKKMILLE